MISSISLPHIGKQFIAASESATIRKAEDASLPLSVYDRRINHAKVTFMFLIGVKS